MIQKHLTYKKSQINLINVRINRIENTSGTDIIIIYFTIKNWLQPDTNMTQTHKKELTVVYLRGLL